MMIPRPSLGLGGLMPETRPLRRMACGTLVSWIAAAMRWLLAIRSPNFNPIRSPAD